MRAAIALTLVALAGCSSPDPTTAPPPDLPPGEVGERVVNGVPSPAAQDAVVYVQSTSYMCSGTLIAPNLVLTARHCVAHCDNVHCTGDLKPSELGVAVGVESSSFAARGLRIVDDEETALDGHDIAVLELDRAIPGAIIAGVRKTPATSGETVTLVGYGEDGITGRNTKGRYQRTGIKILAVGPTRFTFTARSGQQDQVLVPPATIATGEAVCFGDSGGPLLDAHGLIVGVAAAVYSKGGCVDVPGLFNDVASSYAMIAVAAASAGVTLSGGEESGAAQVGATEPPKDDETNQTPHNARSCASAPAAPDAGWGLVGLAVLFGTRRRRGA
jgi:MYXO-CTERM domain-containing protein